jgi:protein-tyrosine phosphatase
MRFPRVEGCRNFRDVGGYRVDGDRTTQWRRLYRGDFVSASAARYLDELGIAEVIDVRTSLERRDRLLGRDR